MQSQANQGSQEYRTLKELTPAHWQSGFAHANDSA